MKKYFIITVIIALGFLSCEKSNATSEEDKVGNYTGTTFQDSTMSINLNMVNGKLMVTNYSMSINFETGTDTPWMIHSETSTLGITEVRNDFFTIIITNKGGLENSSIEGTLVDNTISGNFNLIKSTDTGNNNPILNGSFTATRE